MCRMLMWMAVTGGVVGTVVADWPQFQGPQRSGVIAGAQIARSWPADGPKVLWTRDLGPGFASPAVKDGKVYILDRPDNHRDVLRCLDLATGKEEWTVAYDAPGKLSYNGSRSTPSVCERYVFVVGPFGHFHCIDRATHQSVWTKHLIDDFDGKRPNWGVAQSPLLHGDSVIVMPLGREVGVAAFDKASGKPLWQSPGIGRMEYASPVLATIDGTDQIVAISHKGSATGVEVGTGKVLWQYHGWRCSIPIPTPTPVGDGRLFITGGYKAGSVMIQVTRQGDAFGVKELFRLDDCGSIIHNALLHKGHLYANFNTKRTFDGLACVALDGTVKWKTERSPNYEKGNLIILGDVILTLDGRGGDLAMIEASPAGYKELARARVLSAKPIWAPIVYADGKLLVRDQKQMKCLDVSAK